MSLAIDSITLNNIVGPSTSGETVTITFNQSVADTSLNSFVTITPSYIASLSGDITSSDGGTTFTGTIVRTLGMNRLSNNINITYGALTADATFNVLEASNMFSTDITQVGSNLTGTNHHVWSSVALSNDGSIVAVSWTTHDSNRGMVQVFQNVSNVWTQLGSDILGQATENYFGSGVDLSSDGTIIAIGGMKHSSNNKNRNGHVQIYQWNGTAWVQLGADIVGNNHIEEIGHKLSISSDGTVVAFGTYHNANLIRVYEWNGSAWVQKGTDIVGDLSSDKFGRSLSISNDGTRILVGAPQKDNLGPANGSYGYVSVYDWNGSAWTQVGSNINGVVLDNEFGVAVSLSGDGSTLAVCSIVETFFYQYNGSAWVQKGTSVDDLGTETNVSISNDGIWAIVGSKWSENVIIYKYTNSNWVQQGSISSTGIGYYGNYVAISGNGSHFVSAGSTASQVYSITESLVRSLSSMSMTDTNIKFPETGSTFQINFSTNDKTLDDIQGNVSLDPVGAGSLSGLALANNGFQLTGIFTAAIQESTGNKLKYIEGALNGEVTFILSTTEKAISNICFYGDASVLTNNGYKCISDLSLDNDKIHGQNIKFITKTVTEDKYVVLIKKGSILPNMPSHDTFITKEHKVLFKGNMIEARNLVNNKDIIFVKYNGNTLYNVLLDGDGKMVVNGMIVETLSPDNNIAILHKMIANYSDQQKREIIKIFNEERASFYKNKNKNKQKSILYA